MNTKNLSTKFLAASLAALISVPQIPVSVSAADLKSVSIAGNTYSYSAEALDGYTQIGNSGVYYALTDGTKLSGNLYGTSNLTYKEFYSGDVSRYRQLRCCHNCHNLKSQSSVKCLDRL